MYEPRHQRLLAAMLTAIASLLLLAGCGGGADDGAYEDGLARVKKQLDAASETSASIAADADPDERAAALHTAHEQLKKAAAEAKQLDPPDDARAAHTDLVAALADYADLFERLAAASDDDPAEVTALYGEAGEIVERIGDANTRLKKAGYSVTDSGDTGADG